MTKFVIRHTRMVDAWDLHRGVVLASGRVVESVWRWAHGVDVCFEGEPEWVSYGDGDEVAVRLAADGF